MALANFVNSGQRTHVYIDGFNLFYGCVKGTRWKWLDLSELCRRELPKNDIRLVRYFTALVDARPDDPQQPMRQQTYLRARATIPTLETHFGKFLSSNVDMRLVNPPPAGPGRVRVIKTEEKGSDVNLATYLLCDAFDKKCDVAVVVSNDTDFVEPIKIIRDRFGIKVGVLSPFTKVSWPLRNVATFYRPIRRGLLGQCQFPTVLTDAQGTVTIPSDW